MCDLAGFFPSTLAELGDISRDAIAAPIHYLCNIRELHARILYASLAKNTEAIYVHRNRIAPRNNREQCPIIVSNIAVLFVYMVLYRKLHDDR